MYIELSRRTEVPDEYALEYAMDRCGIDTIHDAPDSEEFKEALVEWFYSGNWIHKEDETS